MNVKLFAKSNALCCEMHWNCTVFDKNKWHGEYLRERKSMKNSNKPIQSNESYWRLVTEIGHVISLNERSTFWNWSLIRIIPIRNYDGTRKSSEEKTNKWTILCCSNFIFCANALCRHKERGGWTTVALYKIKLIRNLLHGGRSLTYS